MFCVVSKKKEKKGISKQVQRCRAGVMLISHCFYASPPSSDQFTFHYLDSIQCGALKEYFIQPKLQMKSQKVLAQAAFEKQAVC